MSLVHAVNAISQQSGIQVIYDAALLKGKRAPAFTGHLTVSQALDKALAGSGLTYEVVNGDTAVIRKTTPPAGKSASQKNPANQSSVGAGGNGTGATTTTLGTVSVTGTRIRGGASASPTITVDQIDFRQQGFTDLGQVIRDIPQNYRGGQNPGVSPNPGSGDVTNQDVTGGSSLDLRGLGPDATLTLLNGHRMSYDGFVQAIDIGAIPIAAVDRLEVVPDGASAIYGSDAVAGVANVILKRDFDGVTLGTRFGSTADGGGMTREYDGTAGTTWNGGGLIATFEKQSQDPIYAYQRDYTQSLDEPSTLYPGNTLKSGLIGLHQSLGEIAEFTLDTLDTTRGDINYNGNPGYYYFSRSQTSALLIAPGLKFYLPGDWTLSTDVTRGRDSSDFTDYYVIPGSSQLQNRGCYCNQSWSWEIGAEGPLFHIDGNEARLAAGAGSRGDNFRVHSEDANNGEGGSEQSRFAYAELSIPFVSAQDAQPGLHRLELSLAARTEKYNSFGNVATPKVGIIYDPISDLSLKASWGRSFKAPTLEQRYEGRISYLWDADQVGGSAYPPGSTVLMSFGGNLALKPERANTATASIDLHPDALPGLDVELSYFRIDYTERVAQPIANISNALSDTAYAQFITYSPTAQQQQQLLKEYGGLFYNFSSGNYHPGNVIAIASDQYTNVYAQRASGIDLNGSYRIKLGSSRLTLSSVGSWLHSSQRDSVDVPDFDLSGTIFHPAKFNGRSGAVWQRGGFSASGFVNYTQGVTSSSMPVPIKTSSFTTIDTTLVYQIGEEHAALDGIVLSIAVQNLLNRKPPLYTPSLPDYEPFDSTNYSAIGRYVSLSVSKHW